MNPASDIIVHKTIDDKFGLSTESGVTLIAPVWDHIKLPVNGVAMVERDRKWGLCSLSGEVLIQPQFDNIFSWNDKYIVVANRDPKSSQIYCSQKYLCGVINWDCEQIIPFKYANIVVYDCGLFKCYSKAEFRYGDNYKMDRLYDTGRSYVWVTINNVEVVKNEGYIHESIDIKDDGYIIGNRVLLNNKQEVVDWVERDEIVYLQFAGSNSIIVKNKRGKYGLRAVTGNNIVLPIYDDMEFINSAIVTLYNGMLGLISNGGLPLLPTNYLEIRCNVLDENNDTIDEYDEFSSCASAYKPGTRAYHYSKQHPFISDEWIQAEESESAVVKTPSFVVGKRHGKSDCERSFICSKNCFGDKHLLFNVVIVRDENGENLFDMNRGFLSDNYYGRITPITKDRYVAKIEEKYELLDASGAEIASVLKFDEGKYYGEGLFYYCIEGLWGAKLIDPTLYHNKNSKRACIDDVDIAPQYLSIEPVSEEALFFVVEKSTTDYASVEHKYSQLISHEGSIVLGYRSEYVGTFKICGNIILAQIRNKYGFVNMDDEMVIPFKYDEVIARNDGGFIVRIGSSWGLLFPDGRESHIKYIDRIDTETRYAIVRDSFTGLMGCLDTDTGIEIVPCLYTLVNVDDGFISVAKGGGIDENWDLGVCYANWGAYNFEGQVIVPVEYDVIEKEEEYILAGYGGGFMRQGQDYYVSGQYNGFYALFNKEGERIISGFSYCRLWDDVWAFYFGRCWEMSCDEEYGYYDFTHDLSVGWWLLLRPDLTTIIPGKDGLPLQLKKGITLPLKKIKRRGKAIYRLSLSSRFFVKDRFYISYDWIISKDGQIATSICDGNKISGYKEVKPISTNLLLFVNDCGRVGVIDALGKIIIEPGFYAFTESLGRYMIGAKRSDEDTYDVSLYDLKAEDILNSAVLLSVEVNEESVMDRFRKCDLVMYKIEDESDELSNIAFENGVSWIRDDVRALFSDIRVDRIKNKEATYADGHPEHCYWIPAHAMDYHYYRDYDYDDGRDYMSDTWDAMTDGMYGDMPDGFGGDFGFLGY